MKSKFVHFHNLFSSVDLTIEARKVDNLEIVDEEEREDLHLDFF